MDTCLQMRKSATRYCTATHTVKCYTTTPTPIDSCRSYHHCFACKPCTSPSVPSPPLFKERVEGEMERQQVGTADRKIVELFRLGRRGRNGECVGLEVDGLEEVALKSVMRAPERTLKAADFVRLKTLKGILDVLSPEQSVDILAGTLHAPDSTAAVGEERR